MIAQKPAIFVGFGLRTLTKQVVLVESVLDILGCSLKLSHPLSLVAIGFFFFKKHFPFRVLKLL